MKHNLNRLFRVTGTLFLLAFLVAGCRSAGGSSTETFAIPFPNDDLTTITLTASAGNMTVRAQDGASLNGTTTTNVGAWRTTSTVGGDSITLTQAQANADVIPNAENIWDIALGRAQPIVLNVQNGAANGNFDLSGLRLRGMTVQGAAGNIALRYPMPNPEADGGQITIRLQNGGVTAHDVLNFHLNLWTITTFGGDVELVFNGLENNLTQDLLVNITTRTGNVRLAVPMTVPSQIIYRTASGVAVTIDPQFQQLDQITYTNSAYADAVTPRLQVDVRTSTGDFHLIGAD